MSEQKALDLISLIVETLRECQLLKTIEEEIDQQQDQINKKAGTKVLYSTHTSISWRLYLDLPDEIKINFKEYFLFHFSNKTKDIVIDLDKGGAISKVTIESESGIKLLKNLLDNTIISYQNNYPGNEDKLSQIIKNSIDEFDAKHASLCQAYSTKLEKRLYDTFINPIELIKEDDLFMDVKETFIIYDEVKGFITETIHKDNIQSKLNNKFSSQTFFIKNTNHKKAFNYVQMNIEKMFKDSSFQLMCLFKQKMEATSDLFLQASDKNPELVESEHFKKSNFYKDHKDKKLCVTNLFQSVDEIPFFLDDYIEYEFCPKDCKSKFYISYDDITKIYNVFIEGRKDILLDINLPHELNVIGTSSFEDLLKIYNNKLYKKQKKQLASYYIDSFLKEMEKEQKATLKKKIETLFSDEVFLKKVKQFVHLKKQLDDYKELSQTAPTEIDKSGKLNITVFYELLDQAKNLITDLNADCLNIYSDPNYIEYPDYDLPKIESNVGYLAEILIISNNFERVKQDKVSVFFNNAASDSKLNAKEVQQLFERLIDYENKSTVMVASRVSNLTDTNEQTELDKKVVADLIENKHIGDLSDSIHADLVIIKQDYKLLYYYNKYREMMVSVRELDKKVNFYKSILKDAGVNFWKLRENFPVIVSVETFYCGIPLPSKDELIKGIKDIGKKITSSSKTYIDNIKNLSTAGKITYSTGLYFTFSDTAKVVNLLHEGKKGEAAFYGSSAIIATFFFNPNSYIKMATFFKQGSVGNKFFNYAGKNFFQSRIFAGTAIFYMFMDLSVEGDKHYNEVSKASNIILKKIFPSKKAPVKKIDISTYKNGVPIQYNWYSEFTKYYMSYSKDNTVYGVSTVNRYSARPFFVFIQNAMKQTKFNNMQDFENPNMSVAAMEDMKTLKKWQKIWAWKDKIWMEEYKKISIFVQDELKKLNNKDWYYKKCFKQGAKYFYSLELAKIFSGLDKKTSITDQVSYFYKNQEGKVVKRKVPVFILLDMVKASKILHYNPTNFRLYEYLMPTMHNKKGQAVRRSIKLPKDGLSFFLNQGFVVLETKNVPTPLIGKTVLTLLNGYKNLEAYIKSFYRDRKSNILLSSPLQRGRLNNFVDYFGDIEAHHPINATTQQLIKNNPNLKGVRDFTSILPSDRFAIPKEIFSFETVVQRNIQEIYFVTAKQIINHKGQKLTRYHLKNFFGEDVGKDLSSNDLKIFRKLCPYILFLKPTTQFDRTYLAQPVYDYYLVDQVGLISREICPFGSLLKNCHSEANIRVIQIRKEEGKKRYYYETASGKEIFSCYSFNELNRKIAFEQKSKNKTYKIISPCQIEFQKLPLMSLGHIWLREGKLTSLSNNHGSLFSENKKTIYYIDYSRKYGGFRLYNDQGIINSYETFSKVLDHFSNKIDDIYLLFKPSQSLNALSIAAGFIEKQSLNIPSLPHHIHKIKEDGSYFIILDSGREGYHFNVKQGTVHRYSSPNDLKAFMLHYHIDLKMISKWSNLSSNKQQVLGYIESGKMTFPYQKKFIDYNKMVKTTERSQKNKKLIDMLKENFEIK